MYVYVCRLCNFDSINCCCSCWCSSDVRGLLVATPVVTVIVVAVILSMLLEVVRFSGDYTFHSYQQHSHRNVTVKQRFSLQLLLFMIVIVKVVVVALSTQLRLTSRHSKGNNNSKRGKWTAKKRESNKIVNKHMPTYKSIYFSMPRSNDRISTTLYKLKKKNLKLKKNNFTIIY